MYATKSLESLLFEQLEGIRNTITNIIETNKNDSFVEVRKNDTLYTFDEIVPYN